MDDNTDTTGHSEAVPGQTIEAFCEGESLSLSSYFKIKRMGLGPYEMQIPGTRIIRVIESSSHWRARMGALKDEKAIARRVFTAMNPIQPHLHPSLLIVFE